LAYYSYFYTIRLFLYIVARKYHAAACDYIRDTPDIAGLKIMKDICLPSWDR